MTASEATMTEDEQVVWRTVQALNRAWTQGRVDELDGYFHDDIVVVTPTDRERLEGKKSCVASWRRFVDTAIIHEWTDRNPTVRLYADAAVVAYDYELACEIRGEPMALAGRDMFFMVRQGGRWVAVADQFFEYPELPDR